MNDLKDIISSKLIDLRSKHRLTQSQMAERLGVALRTYQNYEGALRFPKPVTIEKICKEFGLSQTQLFSSDENGSDVEREELSIEEALQIVKKLSQLDERHRRMIIKQVDTFIEVQSQQAKKAN